MPENFITMLGILTIFLLSGFVFGYLFARSGSRKALHAMEADLENKVKSARGELSLEFAAELGSLRSSLLGVARSYDGALRLIKDNLPEDIDLSRSLADGNSVPAELGFDSSRPVGSPEMPKSEPHSPAETLSAKEETGASLGSDSEKVAQEAVSSRERSQDQDSKRTGLDEKRASENFESVADSKPHSKPQSDTSAESVGPSSIYLANNDFAENDSSDNSKNGRVSRS